MQSAKGQLNFRGERLSMAGSSDSDSDAYFALSSAKLTTAIEIQRADCAHPGCASRKEVVLSWKDFFPSDQESQRDQWHVTRLTALLFADKLTGLGLFPSEAVNFHSSLKHLVKGDDRIEFNYTVVEDDLKVLLGAENGELKASHAGAETTGHHTRPWNSADKSTWFEADSPTEQSNTQSKLESTADAQVPNGAGHRQVIPNVGIMSSRDLFLSYKALSYCVSWMDDQT